MNPITVNEEKCIGCSLCVNDCPSAYLYLKNGKAHAGKSEQYAYKKNEERLPVPVAVVPALIIVVLIVIHNTSRDRQTVTVHYKKSGA